ncbi:DUF1048 domain-containing protein [Furfurilactobacillus curtus]|uniref:Uncharacterized protein n=1 Tax=Furfurilactobacillus curtus TaxID=1746200 RepID=A0ABQ5JPI3_9LACO
MLVLQDYLIQFGGTNAFMQLLDELLQLFQEAASDHQPLSQIVGNGPVAFAEDLLCEYQSETWMREAQAKLQNRFQQLEA